MRAGAPGLRLNDLPFCQGRRSLPLVGAAAGLRSASASAALAAAAAGCCRPSRRLAACTRGLSVTSKQHHGPSRCTAVACLLRGIGWPLAGHRRAACESVCLQLPLQRAFWPSPSGASAQRHRRRRCASLGPATEACAARPHTARASAYFGPVAVGSYVACRQAWELLLQARQCSVQAKKQQTQEQGRDLWTPRGVPRGTGCAPSLGANRCISKG